MKLKYKNLLFVAALLGLTGCNGDLDIQNPNGFSDDDITEKILNGTDEAKKKLVLEGMVNNMQNYILSANAQFANGFSNSARYSGGTEISLYPTTATIWAPSTVSQQPCTHCSTSTRPTPWLSPRTSCCASTVHSATPSRP